MSDWLSLPNLHPAFVHFPVALLPTALVFDAVALIRRRVRQDSAGDDWPSSAAMVLYLAAAASAFLALRSGESAADGFVGLAAEVQPRISAHSDAAHNAAYLLAAVAMLHVGVRFFEQHFRATKIPRIGLLVMAIASSLLVARAADLGGSLVYEHGLGVAAGALEPVPAGPDERVETPSAAAAAGLEAARGRLRHTAGGPLDWRPLAGDGAHLSDLVRPAPGFDLDVVTWSPVPDDADSARAGLDLQVRGEGLLLFAPTFGDVQVDLVLDLSDYEGTAGVAHHVVGTEQRGVFAVATDGRTSLVDLRGGRWTVLDDAAIELPDAPFTLAVSAAGRHLKGMIDGATVTHGHTEPPAAGQCGLLFDGEGIVRILSVAITPL